MHATSCASNCKWSMWERVFTKLLFGLAIERGETMVLIQNYLERNTLPSTYGRGLGGVHSHTLGCHSGE
jgi:hypothetical protein